MRLFTWPVILGLLAAAGVTACEEPPEATEIVRPVRAIQVRTTLPERNWFPGRAQATQETDLAFEVSGRLTERPVSVGDEVKEGDVLARLDPRDFENDLEAAVAERERSRALLGRVKQAAETGAVARQELTNAEAGYRVAVAQVQIKKKALDDAVLRAPFSGSVAWTYVENFDNVRAKQPVIRLVDTSRVEFVVNIPEQYISLAPYVRDVLVRFDIFPDVEVPGEIIEIGTEASQTTRTYPVKLVMDQPEGIRILPGMAGRATGRAEVPGQVREDRGFVVPINAVFTPGEGKGTFVWIIDPEAQTVSRRQVETGPLSVAGIYITSGLNPDEWVATAGVNHLEEGQKVRILQDQGA